MKWSESAVWISLFLVLGSCTMYTHECKADNPYKAEYIASAKAMEWKYDLPRGLVVATCEQESRWNPDAVSDKRAFGLCQIQEPTLTDIIKQVQRDNGLEVDGVLGPKTWAVIRPGVPYRRMSNHARLMDPFQSTEFAALRLKHIQRLVSNNPVIMMGVYYGGAGHQMVVYQKEVSERWGKYD